jgi:cystathionine beta-lyase
MSKGYDFDQVIDRSNSGSAKWEKYRDRDILPMWVADSDFAVAPEIQQALHQRVEHPVFGYTQMPEHLVELIVARMQRLYHWSIEANWVVPLPGVIGAFYLACRANGKPGDTVYLPEIIYPPFTRAPSFNGMVNQPIPMCVRDGRMIIDMDWLPFCYL